MATQRVLPEVTAVDVFCGIGGLTHGLQKSGIRVVAGIDADPSCRYAFEANNNSRFLCQTIEETEPAAVAALYPKGVTKVLVGCAPCQPYSSYAQRNRNDEWQLLENFGNLVPAVDPEVVSMENVTRLVSFNKGKVFESFVSKLEGLGYSVSWSNVYCPLYGIAQERRRLVVFASKKGKIKIVSPTHERDDPPTVRDAIAGLPALAHGNTDPNDPVHRSQALLSRNLRRIRASSPGGTWEDWPLELRAKCHQRETGATYRNVYGRMRWEAPAPTITTGCFSFGRGRFGHPEQDRAISLREAALLQTFPPEYKLVPRDQKASFLHLGRHIGNAVPVALGEVVGRSIVEHISEAQETGP